MAEGMGDKTAIVFEVEVTGSGAAKIRQIAQDAQAIQEAMGKGAQPVADDFNKVAKQTEDMAASLGKSSLAMFGMSAVAQTLTMAFGKIQDVGEGMMGMGVAGLSIFSDTVNMLLDKLGEVEQAVLRIQGLGQMSRDSATQVVKNTMSLANMLPGTFGEFTNLAGNILESGLQLDKVYGTYSQLIEKHASANKQALAFSKEMTGEAQKNYTAMSAVADIATSMGEIGPRFNMFQRLMMAYIGTGNSQHVRGRLSMAVREAIAEEAKKGKGKWDPAAAMEGLVKYLTKTGQVGIALSAGASWQGIQSRFAEMKSKFAVMLGGLPGEGGLFDTLIQKLWKIQSIIMDLMDDPQFKKTMQEGFKPILEIMIGLTEKLGVAFRKLGEFIKENPFFVKVAMWGTLAVSVLALVTGAVISLTATFAALGIAISVMLMFWQFWLAPLAVAVATVSALTSAFIGLLGIMGMAFYKGEEIVQVFDDINLVAKALRMALSGDAFEHFIDQETYDKLAERGLLGVFYRLHDAASKLLDWFDRVKLAIQMKWDNTWSTQMEVAFYRIVSAVGRVIEAIKVAMVELGLLPPVVDSATDASKIGGFEQAVLSVVDAVVLASLTFSKWVQDMSQSIPGMIEVVANLYSAFTFVSDILSIIVEEVKTLGNLLALVAAPVRDIMAAQEKKQSLEEKYRRAQEIGDTAGMRAAQEEWDKTSIWSKTKSAWGDLKQNVANMEKVGAESNKQEATFNRMMEMAKSIRESQQKNAGANLNGEDNVSRLLDRALAGDKSALAQARQQMFSGIAAGPDRTMPMLADPDQIAAIAKQMQAEGYRNQGAPVFGTYYGQNALSQGPIDMSQQSGGNLVIELKNELKLDEVNFAELMRRVEIKMTNKGNGFRSSTQLYTDRPGE